MIVPQNMLRAAIRYGTPSAKEDGVHIRRITGPA